MFHVVAYNVDYFSALWATTQISALISVHVCFSVLLPRTQIIFPHYGPQYGKMICIVAYSIENGQRCRQQCGKMFELDYLHEFETICEFKLGFQSGA
jgi:hypothetical protein